MRKTFIITGPECSGKTSLAIALGKHLKLPWFPEHAVAYLDRINRPYTLEDLSIIGLEQEELRATTLQLPRIFDTSAVVLSIWALEKFGTIPPEIVALLEREKDAHYLLCQPDIEWEEGPHRENRDDRDRLFERYLEFINQRSLHYTLIKGAPGHRFNLALQAIKKS
jgi:nicotinamide riboside kinase